MRALLDISMLLALFDDAHVNHGKAVAWWVANESHGWATSPLTENGYLRIVSQRSYSNPAKLSDAIVTLRRQIAEGGHAFWPDDLSLLDTSIIDHGRVLGPRQLTDIYLLALAVKNGGRFVTLDRSVSLRAVRGARPENLASIF